MESIARARAESPDMSMVGMQAISDSRPIHRVYVDGFWMDTTEVTNDPKGPDLGFRLVKDQGSSMP